jgi:hypothetical protein
VFLPAKIFMLSLKLVNRFYQKRKIVVGNYFEIIILIKEKKIFNTIKDLSRDHKPSSVLVKKKNLKFVRKTSKIVIRKKQL